MNLRPFVYSCLLVASGCATASLNHNASSLLTVTSSPGPECKNLGPVIGQGGGSFGGAWIANNQLIEYALNDARNKAANMGATHLETQAPQLGGSQGTTSTASVIGTAYLCPPGTHGVPEAAAALASEAEVVAPKKEPCPALEGESARQRAIRCKQLAADASGS